MTEEKPKTNCQCELAGYCSRHNVEKTPHWHKLCQNHPGYFNAWEKCMGPGQNQSQCGKKEVAQGPPVVIPPAPQSPQPRQQMPSLFTQAANLAKSATKHALSGGMNVSPEEKQARLDICYGCDKFVKETTRCSACGCYLNTKTEWKTSSCPLNKW
jgi:hypothetical protein